MKLGDERMKKFICPLCCEVAVSGYETLKCGVCGAEMAPITGSFLVRLPDRPGALAEFARQTAERGINILSLRVICKEEDQAVVIFLVDKPEEALTIPGVRRADERDLVGTHFPSLPPE
jgi:hypothetical protein